MENEIRKQSASSSSGRAVYDNPRKKMQIVYNNNMDEHSALKQNEKFGDIFGGANRSGIKNPKDDQGIGLCHKFHATGQCKSTCHLAASHHDLNSREIRSWRDFCGECRTKAKQNRNNRGGNGNYNGGNNNYQGGNNNYQGGNNNYQGGNRRNNGGNNSNYNNYNNNNGNNNGGYNNNGNNNGGNNYNNNQAAPLPPPPQGNVPPPPPYNNNNRNQNHSGSSQGERN